MCPNAVAADCVPIGIDALGIAPPIGFINGIPCKRAASCLLYRACCAALLPATIFAPPPVFATCALILAIAAFTSVPAGRALNLPTFSVPSPNLAIFPLTNAETNG